MLKERVITAAVMLVAFTLLLVFGSVNVFALVLAFVVATAALEWSRLCGVSSDRSQLGYAIAVGVGALVFLYLPIGESGYKPIFLVGLVFWAFVTAMLFSNPVKPAVNAVDTTWLALGCLVLVIAGLSIQYLRSYAPAHSSWLLLYALAVVWVMDSGAYFVGRKLGKRKLAPRISPGKSWEGVYGGLVCCAIYCIAALLIGTWPEGTTFKLLMATVFAAAASVIGDLFESRLKRAAGMKDSSQLLPGHGGVLDRIDGVIAALPVFAFFWAWL